MSRDVLRSLNESDDHLALLQAPDLRLQNRKWRNMAAVQILNPAVGKQLEHDHRRVLADVARAQKHIHEGGNFRKALPGKQLSMNDALQRCRHNRGRDTLPGHVRDGDAHTVIERYRVVKITADRETRFGPGLNRSIGNHGQSNRHQAAVNSRRDSQLLARLASFVFRLREKRIVHQRCCFGGDHVKQLVIDFSEITRPNLAIEIKESKQLTRLRCGDSAAQGNAVDAANLVHQYTWPFRYDFIRLGVADRKLQFAFDCPAHGSPRNGRILFNDPSMRT